MLEIKLPLGNGNPLHYSCLENPMDRGACWATAQGVAESDTTEQLHFMIKKHRLLFLSHVFVAKLLKRYSVTVNLYFFTSLCSFLSTPIWLFFFSPIWLLCLCYLLKCILWRWSTAAISLTSVPRLYPVKLLSSFWSSWWLLILEFLLVFHFLNILKNLGNKHRRVIFFLLLLSAVF